MHIEFIESEPIIKSEPNQISTIANKINSGLIAFENRKAELVELKQQCEGLEIKSIDDKQSILQVVSFRKKLKSERVEIEKEAKSMRDPLTQINRTISEKEKELISIIEPTEKLLSSKEKWVESEKERIRLEVEKKEQERIQKRIDALAAYGYTIDYVVISSVDDATFEKVLANAKVEHEKELAAKAEAEKQAELEKQKLIEERMELEKLRKQQQEAQRIIDQENERIRQEQEAKETAIREEQERLENQKRVIELAKQKEIEDKKRADELQKAKEEAAEKERLRIIEAEKQAKIDAEERLNMASDKVKFQTVISQLGKIKIPEMKSARSKKLAGEVTEQLAKITNYILSNIK